MTCWLGRQDSNLRHLSAQTACWLGRQDSNLRMPVPKTGCSDIRPLQLRRDPQKSAGELP